jgi:hypothetical protein
VGNWGPVAEGGGRQGHMEPIIKDNVFYENGVTHGYHKGVICFQECTVDALIYGNEIYDNYAKSTGMAIYINGGGATIECNIIYDNYATAHVRPEIWAHGEDYAGDLKIFNNLIYNDSDYSEGIQLMYINGVAYIYGNTIAGMPEGYAIQVQHDYQDEVYIFNNILWCDGDYQIYNNSVYSATFEVDYSCCRDGTSGFTGYFAPYIDYGNNNIESNPDFLGGTPPNYHISSESPCIGEGSNTYIDPPYYDIDGQDRNNGTVDMGADEIW